MLAARRAGCVPQLQAAAAPPARRRRRLQPPTRAQGSGGGISRRPKAVVFDLGKVLLDFDYSISARRLAAACRADPTPAKQAALLELFGHAPADCQQGLLDRWGGRSLVEQMERGQISGPQFHQLVCEASGLQLDYATFAELYADIFQPVQLMIQQQQHLVAAGVPTYLLSNVSALHMDDARRRHPFLASFAGLCLSFEVRSFKPEPEIYAAAEALAGLAGGDLLFIDDRADNVAAAAARGWRAVHHTSPRATLAQLAALGLPTVACA